MLLQKQYVTNYVLQHYKVYTRTVLADVQNGKCMWTIVHNKKFQPVTQRTTQSKNDISQN